MNTKTPLRDLDQTEPCDTCKHDISNNERYCPKCGNDLGPPNVRIANRNDEKQELNRKFKLDSKRIDNVNSVKKILGEIERNASVVVTMPAAIAKNIATDKNALYANYEELVGNARRPAKPSHEQKRLLVGNSIFGKYATEIRYGVLSLNGRGLETYGDVHCKLEEIAVKNRTSFLIENSYVFFDRHDLGNIGQFPLGFVANWHNKHKLVLVKIADKITSTTKLPDLEGLLISSDGKNRQNDDFIEAHISGAFNQASIEKMTLPKKNLDRVPRIEAKLAVSEFNKNKGK